MESTDRCPGVAGAGEVVARSGAGEHGALELMVQAARRAADDAGGRLLERVEVVAVPRTFSLAHPDPGRLVAEALGLTGVRTLQGGVGGNVPQSLVNALGAQMAAGCLDVALVVGAETLYSQRDLLGPAAEGLARVEGAEDDGPWWTDEEAAHRMTLPASVYPLFESAVRAAAGRGVADHQRFIAVLWADFAGRSSTRAAAWSQKAWSAEEIGTPGPDNRMITFPYPKLMCANIFVDQAAALLVCTHRAARAAGVCDERVVYLHAGADGADHAFLTERWSLADSAGMRAVLGAALGGAGLDPDAIARFDLYSCFPSAVEVAMGSLGLRGPAAGDHRPLTLTGGLTFFGGPGSNYMTHSIAAMVDACRDDPGSFGMTTGIGWFLTKHSAGIWSTDPPPTGFRPIASVDDARAAPKRRGAGRYDGSAVIETVAVTHDRDGRPAFATMTALTPDGRRALANATDPALLSSMITEEWVGREVVLHGGGPINRLQT